MLKKDFIKSVRTKTFKKSIYILINYKKEKSKIFKI